MTLNEQRKMLDDIRSLISGLFDYLYDESSETPWLRETMNEIETKVETLRESMADEETYITMRDRNDGEVQVRHFDDTDEGLNEMLTLASKIYCFDDCDDTWEIMSIVYRSKDLHYTGWRPGMVFEFADDKGEVVWSRAFEHWDH